MRYSIVAILIDTQGKTIGARIKNLDTLKTDDITTQQLISAKSKNMLPENAVITKDGFVRAKSGTKPLQKLVKNTKPSAVEQGEIISAKRILKNNILTLYHGNKDKDMTPKFGFGTDNNDYGAGFYTTPDIELGKEWAWSDFTGGSKGYLHTYEIDIAGLNILNFTEYDSIHWIAELVSHRNINFNMSNSRIDSEVCIDNMRELIKKYKVNTDSYDIIIGYRADGSYFQFAARFVAGTMYKYQLDKALRLGNLGIQVFIKSKQAFSRLKLKSVEEVPKIYQKKFKVRDQDARNKLSIIQSDRTQAQNIDKRTISKILEEGIL